MAQRYQEGSKYECKFKKHNGHAYFLLPNNVQKLVVLSIGDDSTTYSETLLC